MKSSEPPSPMPTSDSEHDDNATSNESACEDFTKRKAKCTKTVSLTQDQIDSFVMKEAKAKLESGLSVPEIEEHLRNAATLLGEDKLPSKWTDVLECRIQGTTTFQGICFLNTFLLA